MMKSRQSLKSLAKSGLRLFPLILFLSACTSSTSPTFSKEKIPQAITEICKKEYKLDIPAHLTGNTLWIYMPLEDMLETKPSKYVERFIVEDKKNFFVNKILKGNYYVKPTAEKEKWHEWAIKKETNEKIFKVLQVIRRVLFSIDHSDKNNPVFFVIVTADIRNGFEIIQTFYLLDLKKLSYGIISQTEYQHRIPQEQVVSAKIIGDKEGAHIDYRDISLEEFITSQIQNRILLKFGKPEVEKNVDIDKEVLRIVSYTLNIYDFKDFNFVELMNLVSGAKVTLNQKAVLDDSGE